MKTYHIRTFGCQMNERDSETIAGLLEQMGYARASDTSDADVIVLNTCSVRENADNHFFGLLGQTKHVKEKRPETIVAACGCMMQQAHIVDRIHDKFAWVDLVFGTHNIDRLPELIDEVLSSRKKAADLQTRLQSENITQRERRKKKPKTVPNVAIEKERAGIVEGLPVKRESAVKAFVNILYGCDNFCTYCIVPYTRGREVSRVPERILSEIRELAAFGTKEITLLGQNVNSYSGAFAGGFASGSADGSSDGISYETLPGDASRLDFAGLLEAIDRDKGAEGVRRVRFMTSHPKDLTGRLIACFDTNSGLKKLCPSIHLPVQAGSDLVLTRMNRRYTKEGYIDLVTQLRAVNPEIVISTDFIVGFPGETEEDFAETMDLIERVRFDSAFTFLFSPREGTPAARYENQVPEADKHTRFDRMVECLNAIAFEKNQAYVGQIHEVLIDGFAPVQNAASSKERGAMLTGRTFGGKLVNFPAPADASAGTPAGAIPAASAANPFVRVRITGANTFSLLGEIVN
ncbi:tRNA-2-methylthio-N(6)-dimethylallyladenosine synthase [Clostridia bacterium]|nr:tRNA-2-methylthio-N(6)-dimethylallyladenosine synthase [Clostridia bacterium]